MKVVQHVDGNLIVMQDFFSTNYELDIVSVRSHNVGYNNIAKIIESTQGKFFFKIYKRISSDKLEKALDVISFLSNNYFPVPKIQKTVTGDQISIFDNKPGVLFDYLPGTIKTHFSKKELFCVGQTLAKMHNCLAEYPNLDDFITPNEDYNSTFWYDQNITHLSKDSSEEVKLISDEYQYLKKIKPNIDLNKLPLSLLHWDFRNENILFNDSIISGITDFECLHYDNRLYDLVFSTIGFGMLDKGLNKNYMNDILQGYQSITQLSDDELSMFPYLLKLMTWDKWCSIYISSKSPDFNTRQSRTMYNHYRGCFYEVKDDDIL